MTLHKGGSQDLIRTEKHSAVCCHERPAPAKVVSRAKPDSRGVRGGDPLGHSPRVGQQAAESPPESRDGLFATTIYHCQGEVGELSRIL